MAHYYDEHDLHHLKEMAQLAAKDEVHVKNARKAGASKAEVAEAVLLAAALRAGGAAAHGSQAMKLYDQG